MSRVRIERHDTLDSTNLHARRRVQAGALAAADGPMLYVAAEQSGGIGRLGRAWSSPRGGLWMTLACPVEPARAGLETLGLRTGAACLAAVLRLCEGRDGDVRLKWPNDVLIGGRKVLGTLCEMVRGPAERAGAMWALIGVGVNANFRASALPASLRREPATLLDALGAEVDLDALRDDLCARLLAAVRDPAPSAALALARERLYGVGARVSLHLPDGSGTWGTLAGLSDAGLPVVRTATGDAAAPTGAEMTILPGPVP